jgi:hypothetical protein
MAGTDGAASAIASAATVRGAPASAQATAMGSSGQAKSTAATSFTNLKLQSTATAEVGGTATANASAQAGGSGPAFANPGQTSYALAVGSPSKSYAATLIGGASDVAKALLGLRDQVFGTAILGGNYAPDGGGESQTYRASAEFQFRYGGDLSLGLIDNQPAGFPAGAGFQSVQFTVMNGSAELLDKTFTGLGDAESYFADRVVDLGRSPGVPFDLTFSYTLTASGVGGFGLDFAIGDPVPEPSTWIMLSLGFAGLGFCGYRASRLSGLFGPVAQHRCSHNSPSLRSSLSDLG